MDTAEGKIPVDDACIRCDAEIEVVEDEYPESRRRVPRPGASPKTELAPKTSAALREKILTRDGNRCRCCGRRRMLSVHHIVFRSKGGETRGANEITLCDRCHALIHDELLFIEGPDARHARFVDRKGRRLRESCGTVEAREEAKLACAMTRQPGAASTQAVTYAKSGRKTVTLASLPATVDGAWWRRHADLVEFKKGKGLLFRPGVPLPEEEPAGDSQEEAKEERKAFEGLVGQDVRVEHFRTLAKGSRELGEPFPHTLFLGPPGTGKTTLARQVSTLVGGRLHATSGPLLEDTHALLRVLAGLEAGDVLFLDEVHAVPQPVLEVLYEAMTDRRLSLTLYEGSRSRTLRLELPPFTLLAATTEGGALPDALKSRFLLRESLGPYGLDDLAALLQDRAQARGLDLQELVARTLAWFARGTPREGLRLLECVGRSAAGRGETSVDLTAMDATLREMGFDFQGLRPDEQRYLEVLEDSDQPIPLHRLARELGVSPAEVLQDIEPLLFRRGLVRMTPRGRAPVGYAPLALAREG